MEDILKITESQYTDPAYDRFTIELAKFLTKSCIGSDPIEFDVKITDIATDSSFKVEYTLHMKLGKDETKIADFKNSIYHQTQIECERNYRSASTREKTLCVTTMTPDGKKTAMHADYITTIIYNLLDVCFNGAIFAEKSE